MGFPAPIERQIFNPVAWVFLFLHVVWMPYSVLRARRRTAQLTSYPSRVKHSITVLLSQALLAVAALVVARTQGLELFPRVMPGPGGLAWGLALLAGMLALAWPMWRDAVRRRVWRLYFVMPQSVPERVLWVARSLAAGVGEEITYRGVLFALLLGLTHQVAFAVVLQAVVFALAHAHQERKSMAMIFAFSLALQLLVLHTGALWVVMGVHALYDAIAGFAYSKLGRELGYPPEGIPLPAPDGATGSVAPPAPIVASSSGSSRT